MTSKINRMWVILSAMFVLAILSFYWLSVDLRMLFIAVPGIVYNFRNPIQPNQPVSWRKLESKANSKSIKNDQPNLILIVADDLGINDLSGGAGVLTPNIDSIRHNGVHFKNAYAAQSTCAPSRAAMFTGRFPTKIGFEFTPMPLTLSKTIALLESDPLHPSIFRKDLQHLVPPLNEMAIPANVTTLPEALKKHGYDNYLIGKWHLGNSKGSSTPLDRGFDEALTFPIGLPSYLPKNDPDVVSAILPGFFDEFMRENLPFSVTFNNGLPFKPDEYMTDYLTHRAVDLIKSKKDTNKPFFLSLTYNAPHTPLQAKRSDFEDPEVAKIENHAGRVYAAMIKALDRGVGEVIDALKETNQYENTIIVFTSDNGGAHYLGLNHVNAPYRGWKCTFYEGGIRVPMMLQWPQLLPKNIQFEEFVSHMDIFATFQAAASGKYSYGKAVNSKPAVLEEGIDGVDLLPHLIKLRMNGAPKSTNNVDKNPHEYLFWRAGHYLALRFGDWKLQISDRPDKVSFFNLRTDPEEREDLASKVGVETKSQLEVAFANSQLSELTFNASKTYLQQLNLVYGELLQVQSIQVQPLWPSILETAIPLDKHAIDDLTPDDDYIYFVN